MAEQPRQGPGEHWEKKRGNENLVAPSLVEQGTDKNVRSGVNNSKADADDATLIEQVELKAA